MVFVKLLKWLLVLLAVMQLPFLYSVVETYQLRRYLQHLPREGVEIAAPFQDLRGAIHVHSLLGGHSLATYREIIQAAKDTNCDYIFVTEHPKDEFLCRKSQDPSVVMIYGHEEIQEESFRVLSSGAQEVTFLTHVKGSVDPSGFTGLELFNLHESSLEQSSWYQRAKFLYNRVFFPGLSFFHVWTLDPKRFRLWDNFLQKHPLAGVAGNDAHQNVGIILQTASGEKLFSVLLDPYVETLRFVTTHVLLPRGQEISEKNILAALKKGAAYIAFEMIADPAGFSFHARAAGKVFPMGSRVRSEARLVFQSPSPARFVLIRNGSTYKELSGRRFSLKAKQPGVYRLEVYPLRPPRLLEGKPWIISNPIVVQ